MRLPRLVDFDWTQPPVNVEGAWGLVARRLGRAVAVGLRRDGERDAAFLERTLAEASGHAMVDILRETWCVPSQPSTARLTIAICTRERATLLDRVLDSLDGFSRHCEILVVDNAPLTSATYDVVARHPACVYLREPAAGLDIARNAAWRKATGDWIAYLDDDVVVDPDWYDSFMRTVALFPSAGAITGLILPLSLETDAQVLFEKRGGFRRGLVPRVWRGGEHVSAEGYMHESDPIFPLGSGQFGTGCNMAFRRSLLAEIGGFDEALDTGAPLPGGGDLDMFFRVLDRGESLIYEPAMSVRHEHRTDIEGLRRQYHSWGLGFFAYLGAVRVRYPGRSQQIRAMIRWWTMDWLRSLVLSWLGRGTTPPGLLLAEGRGAIEGYLGEYQRSRTRMREQREGR